MRAAVFRDEAVRRRRCGSPDKLRWSNRPANYSTANKPGNSDTLGKPVRTVPWATTARRLGCRPEAAGRRQALHRTPPISRAVAPPKGPLVPIADWLGRALR